MGRHAPMTPPTRPPPRPAPAAGERAPPTPAEAAGAFLLALVRAARSVLLYDPNNAIVRQFLGEYRAKARAALGAHGELVLEVRPFEIAVAGEVAYRDDDREKSLAFRLFRDGVRRLAISRDATWDELQQLLVIAALRLTGVRQQEEDAVTLFRNAAFTGIAIRAVEGFAAAEEAPELGDDDALGRASRFRPPGGWDTPLPILPQPVVPTFRTVGDDELAPLRAESDEEEVSTIALSVARDLLQEAARAGWPAPNEDLVAFVAELRDGLLADGQLAALRRLVDLLGETGGRELRDSMLRGLADARTL